MIICKDVDTNKVRIFKNVKAVVKEINRDRSNDWQPYTIRDWKEGLANFTAYIILEQE